MFVTRQAGLLTDAGDHEVELLPLCLHIQERLKGNLWPGLVGLPRLLQELGVVFRVFFAQAPLFILEFAHEARKRGLRRTVLFAPC